MAHVEPAPSPLYALLVSVSQYPASGARALPNAKNDAVDLKRLLDDGRTFLSTPIVTWLHDGEANKQAIEDGITRWLGSAPVESTVLFYFAGHGVRVKQRGTHTSYLLLGESSIDDAHEVVEQAISAADLRAALATVTARRQFIVLDCCHAQGLLGARDLIPFQGADAHMEMTGLHGRGRALLAACRTNERAYEVGTNGLLTKHLLEGLRGAAAGLDGNISLLDLAGHVLRQPELDAHQIPVFGANDLEYYPIARCDPDQVLAQTEWRILHQKLLTSSAEVLDHLLDLYGLAGGVPSIGQSPNDKAKQLVNRARERGTRGRLELDQYLASDPALVRTDMLRRRISQDLRRLNFVDQGLQFERSLRDRPRRGAFLLHGRSLALEEDSADPSPSSPYTAHRWLLRRLLHEVIGAQWQEQCILPVHTGVRGRDAQHGNLQIQLARALGSRGRDWPVLVANAVKRGAAVFIIEPIEELRAAELEELLTQFWTPLNAALDQLASVSGPVLLFLLCYDEQPPVLPEGFVAPQRRIRVPSATEVLGLHPIEPLTMSVVMSWLDEVRRSWHDDPAEILRLGEALEATQIRPYEVFESYVNLRLGQLDDTEWNRAREQLEAEWFLLNLPKR